MNGEWAFQILLVVISVGVSAPLSYYLGLRNQRIQTIREYIIDVVKDKYPALFNELRFNSETLDNYLEKPNVNFDFSGLREIYYRGRDEFVKSHHSDLFSMIDSVHKNILPQFDELSVMELMEQLFGISSKLLRQSLPKDVAHMSDKIALDLAKSINPYYIIPDLLNGRDEKIRMKIEGCILDRTAHIYREKAKIPYFIRGQTEVIDYDKISQSLIEKAKPEAKTLVGKFKRLKKQNDEEVREKLLPLLQKYISNPI